METLIIIKKLIVKSQNDLLILYVLVMIQHVFIKIFFNQKYYKIFFIFLPYSQLLENTPTNELSLRFLKK